MNPHPDHDLDELAAPATLTFRDQDSASAQRARDEGAFVTPRARAEFGVMLGDSSATEPYSVVLALDGVQGAWYGRCNCPGFYYKSGDSPACAHLWGVYTWVGKLGEEFPSISELLERNVECPTCDRAVARHDAPRAIHE